MDLKIFVDTDDSLRLSRRIMRDMKERGEDVNTTINMYTKFVKPAFDEFVGPTIKWADIIIPNNGNEQNEIAIDFLVRNIRCIMEGTEGNYQRIEENENENKVDN